MKAILAVGPQGAIGYKGGMPWPMSKTDLKRFASLTKGENVIMGRKTWESLPSKHKPLKNRRNIVMTTSSGFRVPGGYKAMSKEEALARCDDDKDIWIMGGAQIYDLFFDDCSEFHISYFPVADSKHDTSLDMSRFRRLINTYTEVCKDHVYQILKRQAC